MTIAPATNGADRLDLYNWNYDWTDFYMLGGDDYVDAQDPSVSYTNGGLL